MKKKALYETIYDDLLEGIRTGKYGKGARLPSEKELSEQYSVSRITSKRALEQLADEGIIIRMPGKGSFVSDQPLPKEIINETAEPSSRECRLIGVIMESFGGSFGSQMIAGVEEECRKRGFNMVLRCSLGNQKEEAAAIDEMLALGVKGMLIMCVHEENYSSKILELAVSGFPIVLMDRQMKGVPLPFVGTDNHKAAKELTDYLFQEGHREIAFISHAAMGTPTIADRFSGFVDSNLEHGIITNENDWVTNLKSSLPNAVADERVIEADILKLKNFILKHQEITAYFVVEYEIAIMVKKTLEDVYGSEASARTVVCFDGPSNIIQEFVFTHIRQNEAGIGRRAVEILSEMVGGTRNTGCSYLPYTIEYGIDDWYK